MKPQDREVVCHASAWDVDYVDDLRIKMCIDITAEDFTTVHHELGHNFYQRAYNAQPPLFRDSANDGFHEAIGDTIALSVTPEYLVKLGLLDQRAGHLEGHRPAARKALEKVAFLPFGLLIDQWRWKVFSGEITPAQYNKAWWDLRLKYQGVAPPVARTEEDFDPGAKYHVAGERALHALLPGATSCSSSSTARSRKTAGCTEPLNRCSIYGNKEAGRSAGDDARDGAEPAVAGRARDADRASAQMDATAIRDYFAPLQKWLDEQNKGKPVGW